MTDPRPPGEVTIENYAGAGGTALKVRHWANDSPKGLVVCLHGIQSHGGWYLESCAHFARQGYEVYFLDRRGSGISAGRRGDTPSYRVLFDDIDCFFEYAKPDAALPVHLVGISWGGKLACCYTIAAARKPASLTLVCPGIMPQTRLPFRQILQVALAAMFCPGKAFEIPLNNPRLFTENDERAAFIACDPLKNTHATARLMVQSTHLDRFLARNMDKLTVPILLVMAGRDRICNNARLAAFLEQVPAAKKKAVTYPGASHTVEFEPDPAPFFDELVRWFDEFSSRREVR